MTEAISDEDLERLDALRGRADALGKRMDAYERQDDWSPEAREAVAKAKYALPEGSEPDWFKGMSPKDKVLALKLIKKHS